MTNKFLYVLLTLLVFTLIISPFFIKAKVQCKSQKGECPKETNAKLQMLNDKYLFSAKRQASKLLKKDFLVSTFSMQLKLPNILFINIIPKTPEFSIFGKVQNKYLLIDENGSVLDLSDSSNLPNISKDATTEKPGQTISKSELFALKLVQGINQMYQVNTGTIQNDTLVVDLPGAVRVILPLVDSDPQVLLGSLRLIYTKITSKYAGIYSQIDMRFKNPVIR